jgi:uncharacterized protein
MPPSGNNLASSSPLTARIRARANTYTFYLRYTGPLPRSNDVKVDVTLNEVLYFPLADKPVLRGYPEFSDLPEDRPILVYSLDEIATEKTLALTDSARNEPRDLYDLWYLTNNAEVHLEHIVPAICQKLEFREKPCQGLQVALARKEARLRTLWNTRLAHQMATLPPFAQVFREMRRTFRQANLP